MKRKKLTPFDVLRIWKAEQDVTELNIVKPLKGTVERAVYEELVNRELGTRRRVSKRKFDPHLTPISIQKRPK